MAAKYFLIVLVALCLFQMYQAARLVPRSADEETSSSSGNLAKAGETISRAFDTLTDGIKDLVDKAPTLDDIVSGARKLGSQVEELGQQVASRINSPDTKTTST